EYRKAELTHVGEEAAQELVDVLRQQRPSRVVLVGHSDIRGTAEFNMKLSHDRAETIAAFLRQNGLDVTIEAVGKGATEPVHLSDASGLTQEDIYALDRRVEWRRQKPSGIGECAAPGPYSPPCARPVLSGFASPVGERPPAPPA